MKLPIQAAVVWTFSVIPFGRLMRQDDPLQHSFDDPFVKGLSFIATVINQTVKGQAIYQLDRLADGRCLSGGQVQMQGIAQALNSDVNLGREPGTPPDLRLAPPMRRLLGSQQRRDDPEQWYCLIIPCSILNVNTL